MASATDNFNRANETPLAGNWTRTTGGSGNINLASNQITPSASGDKFYYWNGFTPTNDQYAQAVTPVIDTSNWDGGPAVRVATGALTGYWASDDGDFPGQSQNTVLQKLVSGTYTKLTAAGTGPNDGNTLRIEAEGTTIRGKVNGVQQVSVTDSSIASGRVGVFIYEGLELDDWEGGDLTAAFDASLLSHKQYPDRIFSKKKPEPYFFKEKTQWAQNTPKQGKRTLLPLPLRPLCT